MPDLTLVTDPVEAARRLAPTAAELAPGGRARPAAGRAARRRARRRRPVPAVRARGRRRPRGASRHARRRGPGAGRGRRRRRLVRRHRAPPAGWSPAICPRRPPARSTPSRRRWSPGVFAPKGRATPEPGGYRVSGRWPFASGCRHADWLMGGCVVDGGMRAPDGSPSCSPAEAFTIHDTWHVMGLRATGSHDIELDGVHIPAERSASVFGDPPVQPGPLYAFPLFGLLALAISAVCLGIARGALDDLDRAGRRQGPHRRAADAGRARRPCRRRSRAPRPPCAPPARCSTRRSARRGSARSPARASTSSSRAALRLAATHATAVSQRATDTAYTLAGGSAMYESSPLQRRAARRPRGHAAHARRARHLGAHRPRAARDADRRHPAY